MPERRIDPPVGSPASRLCQRECTVAKCPWPWADPYRMVLSRGKRPTAHPRDAPGRGQSTGGPGWKEERKRWVRFVRDQTTIWELITDHVNGEQEGWRLEADSCSKMQRTAKYRYFSTAAGWATGSGFVSYLAAQASRSKGRGVPSTRAHDALALHARLSWSLSAPVFDSPVALLGLCGVRSCCSRLQPMTS